MAESPDTFPKLLMERVARTGGEHAIREKNLGIWQSWTWREVHEEVKIKRQASSSASDRKISALMKPLSALWCSTESR